MKQLRFRRGREEWRHFACSLNYRVFNVKTLKLKLQNILHSKNDTTFILLRQSIALYKRLTVKIIFDKKNV